MPRRFQDFETGDAEGGAKGSGLGLALCKSAVEAHGGHIGCEAEPGNGSRFCFSSFLAGETMMSGGTKGMTVLMVDDDEDFAMLLWGILDEGGYRVVTATDSNKVRECLRDLRPDLITLDIMMANKTGMRLYREVRNDEKLCTIPIVVITGSMTAGEEFRKLIEADQLPPPNGYLGKPVDRNALAATLHCILGS